MESAVKVGPAPTAGVPLRQSRGRSSSPSSRLASSLSTAEKRSARSRSPSNHVREHKTMRRETSPKSPLRQPGAHTDSDEGTPAVDYTGATWRAPAELQRASLGLEAKSVYAALNAKVHDLSTVTTKSATGIPDDTTILAIVAIDETSREGLDVVQGSALTRRVLHTLLSTASVSFLDEPDTHSCGPRCTSARSYLRCSVIDFESSTIGQMWLACAAISARDVARLRSSALARKEAPYFDGDTEDYPQLDVAPGKPHGCDYPLTYCVRGATHPHTVDQARVVTVFVSLTSE